MWWRVTASRPTSMRISTEPAEPSSAGPFRRSRRSPPKTGSGSGAGGVSAPWPRPAAWASRARRTSWSTWASARNSRTPSEPSYARRGVKHVDNFFAPNIWPDTERLRHAMERYHAEAGRTGLPAAADLRNSPGLATRLVSTTSSSNRARRCSSTTTRRRSPDPSPGQFRRGQHTDYGALTVLYTDEESGLQVQGSDGEWCDVPVVPGTYVINIGDLMARWSNHRWALQHAPGGLPGRHQHRPAVGAAVLQSQPRRAGPDRADLPGTRRASRRSGDRRRMDSPKDLRHHLNAHRWNAVTPRGRTIRLLSTGSSRSSTGSSRPRWEPTWACRATGPPPQV